MSQRDQTSRRGKSRRVLFICEGNLHRSPTAQALYAHTPELKVRSAGTSPLARVQVTEELLAWADDLFVMDRGVARSLRRRFPQLAARVLVCLEVADEYQYLQPELVAVLRERLEPYL